MTPPRRRSLSVAAVAVIALAMPGLAAVPAAAVTPTCGGEPATLVGTGGDDVLVGTDAFEPDVIVGLGGDDDIRGLSGSDLLCGGTGDDEIRGGPGPRDKIFGGTGHDLLLGGPDQDRIAGGAGGDRIRGGVGNDSLHGGDGNDTVAANEFAPSEAGDSGPNTLSGGDGDDVLYGATCTEPPADEVGCSVYDESHLSGGPGSDRILAGDSSDIIRPGNGSDVVNGGGGPDVVSFYPGPGDEGVTVDLAEGLARTARGTDRLRGVEAADGTRHADVLRGDGERNILRGFEGADVISGRGGNDRNRQGQLTGLDGGLGHDRIFGGPGNDALTDDSFEGDGQADLVGGDGDDVLSLLTATRTSSVDGGAGRDTFIAVGAGDESRLDDNLIVDLGAAFAGNLADRSWNMPLANTENAITGSGHDRILGDNGANVLYGGERNDELFGRSGDDILWGGPQADELFGGPDTDTCYASNIFDYSPDAEPDVTHACEELPPGMPTNHPA